VAPIQTSLHSVRYILHDWEYPGNLDKDLDHMVDLSCNNAHVGKEPYLALKILVHGNRTGFTSCRTYCKSTIQIGVRIQKHLLILCGSIMRILSNAHSLTSFFLKKLFSFNYVLVTPLKIVGVEVCLNSESV
jgi:hypothetical protein